MEHRIKPFQKVLSLIITAICLIITIIYGWICFVTIANRSGLNGSLYLYYNVSARLFILYNLAVAFIAAWIIARVSRALIYRRQAYLTKTLRLFLYFGLLLIVCEICLQLRFVGKG